MQDLSKKKNKKQNGHATNENCRDISLKTQIQSLHLDIQIVQNKINNTINLIII